MNETTTAATKGKLMQEFDTVVAETEQLIKTAAGAGSEKAGALRASVEDQFSAATERLARLRDDAMTQATAVAKSTDAYVLGNPWRSVGIVATFAVAAGLIAGMIVSRR
jgi:ElaB/YqjD/DUF883 family membrane-anchored ribosome-binding protein